MEERSAFDVEYKQDNNYSDDDDDDGGMEVEEQIEGYSSSTPGTSSKSCRHQRKDGDDQLDDDDFERILSRTTARRLISLFEAPEFVQRLRAYDETDAGGTVTFSAQYRATPTPTVKWFKDEEEVRATERHRLDDDQTNGIIRLTIRDVVEADEGAYKCKVENREGVASTTGYLSVAGKRPVRSKSGRSSGAAGTSGSKVSTPAPGVSTPPYLLGPIAEQQSMEEREELELKRQPPSPLQHFIDSIRHSAKAKHAPIYYGTEDLFSGPQDRSEHDDVFDESTTPSSRLSTDADTESSSSTDNAAVDRSTCDHRHAGAATATEAVVRPARSTDDDPRSAAADPERRSSGFQRRRLGQLQLKRRLAVDLPEHNSTCPDGLDATADDFQATYAVDRPSSFAAETQKDVALLSSLWNSLDDCLCQLYIALVVVLSALASAFSVPPSWLIFVVVGLSLLIFVIDERQRAEP